LFIHDNSGTSSNEISRKNNNNCCFNSIIWQYPVPLSGSHTAEVKTKQKAHAKNHCKISNKNNHHSHDNVNENQQFRVSAAVNLKNVDVDFGGLFD